MFVVSEDLVFHFDGGSCRRGRRRRCAAPTIKSSSARRASRRTAEDARTPHGHRWKLLQLSDDNALKSTMTLARRPLGGRRCGLRELYDLARLLTHEGRHVELVDVDSAQPREGLPWCEVVSLHERRQRHGARS